MDLQQTWVPGLILELLPDFRPNFFQLRSIRGHGCTPLNVRKKVRIRVGAMYCGYGWYVQHTEALLSIGPLESSLHEELSNNSGELSGVLFPETLDSSGSFSEAKVADSEVKETYHTEHVCDWRTTLRCPPLPLWMPCQLFGVLHKSIQSTLVDPTVATSRGAVCVHSKRFALDTLSNLGMQSAQSADQLSLPSPSTNASPA